MKIFNLFSIVFLNGETLIIFGGYQTAPSLNRFGVFEEVKTFWKKFPTKIYELRLVLLDSNKQ